MKKQDKTLPSGKWEFDSQVTKVFDDMLARSIPQYSEMRKTVTNIASRFMRPGQAVVDLGCSRGEALAPLISKHGGLGNTFIGCDVSEPMLEAARERFADEISRKVVDIRRVDLRSDFPKCSPSVVLSVLTIQFTPIEYRPHILRRIYDSLVPGGALILVEKIIGETATFDKMFVDLYYDMKRENGYSDEQIARKKLSLEGVLVPVTARANEELLRCAGFRDVECFWRWMNFTGWVAVKNATI